MKKKYLLASSVVLSLSLLTGVGTYAFFNAQTSTTNNNFTSGTIAISSHRDSSDPIDGPLFYTTEDLGAVTSGDNTGLKGKYPDEIIKPGFESKFKTLVISNEGSINPKLTGVSAEYVEGDRDLADALTAKIYRVNELGTPPTELWSGSLTSLLNGTESFNTNINIDGVGTIETLAFKVLFPDNNAPQNQYQGKSLKIHFHVYADPQ